MAACARSLWNGVGLPFLIGLVAGLTVNLIVCVVGMLCVWLWEFMRADQPVGAAADADAAMPDSEGGDGNATAAGSGHPGGSPSNRGIPNAEVEIMARLQNSTLIPRESTPDPEAAAAPASLDLEMGTRNGTVEVLTIHSATTLGDEFPTPRI